MHCSVGKWIFLILGRVAPCDFPQQTTFGCSSVTTGPRISLREFSSENHSERPFPSFGKLTPSLCLRLRVSQSRCRSDQSRAQTCPRTVVAAEAVNSWPSRHNGSTTKVSRPVGSLGCDRWNPLSQTLQPLARNLSPFHSFQAGPLKRSLFSRTFSRTGCFQ